jgi:hypothetical protein
MSKEVWCLLPESLSRSLDRLAWASTPPLKLTLNVSTFGLDAD